MVRKTYHDTRTPTSVLNDEQKKQIPCKFLASKGKCNKGDKCPFSHDSALVEQKREAQEVAKGEPKPEEIKDGDKKEDESEDEEAWQKEDEYGKKAMKDELDVQMFQVIDMIRRDDPKLYDESAEFFSEPTEEDENNKEDVGIEEIEAPNAEEVRRKKEQLINKFFANRAHERSGKKQASNITDEDYEQMQKIQRDAKDAFKRAAENMGDDEEFFSLHNKSKGEEAMEESEYQQFLQDQEKKNKEADMEEAANLSRIFDNKGQLSADEQFLRDYLLHKGWVNPVDSEVLKNEDIVGPTDMMLTDEQIEEIEDQEEELKLLEEHQLKQAESRDTYSHQQQIFTPAPEIVKQFSERRQRLTKRHKDRLRRNLRYKQQRDEIEADLDKKKEAKRKQIFDLIVELKEAIKGDGSATDKLVLESVEKDFDKKIDTNKITKELYYSMGDDDTMDYDENGTSVPDLRKRIKKAFDEYYKLFYQDMMLFTPVRFQYAKAEPEKSSKLSVADILMMDDEELDRIEPIRNLKTYDGEEAPELTKYIDKEVQRQYTTPNNFQWDGDFDSLKELARKRKRAEKKKQRRLIKEQGAVQPAVLSEEWNNAKDEPAEEKQEKPKKKKEVKKVEEKVEQQVEEKQQEIKPVERKRKQNLFEWGNDESEQPYRKKPRFEKNYNNNDYNNDQSFDKPPRQEFKKPAQVAKPVETKQAVPAIAPAPVVQQAAQSAEEKKKTRRGKRGKKKATAE